MGELYLGIEIGGTKIQLGVGTGSGTPLVALERCDVDRGAGADGIRGQISQIGKSLIVRHGIQRIAIGFGGPVDAARGRVIKSHQIDGWDGFPICEWCRRTLGLPTVLENDSNLAGLGEARFGAGRDARVVFYSNVGSGIGGALVIDGDLYLGGTGRAVAEIGHLRPGTQAVDPDQTVESVASGWGLAARAQARVSQIESINGEEPAGSLALTGGDPSQLTGELVSQAAVAGNAVAVELLNDAVRTYGWALAQVVTLIAPNVLVIGGGVAQTGESLFFAPLRQAVDRYVMPALRGTYELRPAALGDEVVVHGALTLAAKHA